ncbi:helix-turn-helix domain-containing protein [Azospirillum isscasi]|uniref:Helix-turn-helix domain-containing protein n=1 Tax=Azospirillum isscasi TaxID=3053926 RepID=A0ABU0WLG6_9PROT|nr:helix-turn-helix domain-containing protein [Azospirillum isscasi]MDQ2104662.1 helix-turn-helix domain-containing protein [Azospirillum isscasi]
MSISLNESDHASIGQPASGRWGRIPAWWLDHPHLDADGFAVLAALATYADDQGICWPSQSTLAAKLKRSRPTINRILQRLDEIGLVEIVHRRGSNGARLSCLYRLRFATADEAAATSAVPVIDRDDSPVNAPCPAPSQEQLHSEQIPDSLSGCTREPLQEVTEDWMPDAADLSWARARFGHVDLARHSEGFVLRCRAHGYRYRNVGAAWRSWLAQDVAAGKAPIVSGTVLATAPATPGSRSRETAAEQRLNAWAAAAARLTPNRAAHSPI